MEKNKHWGDKWEGKEEKEINTSKTNQKEKQLKS